MTAFLTLVALWCGQPGPNGPTAGQVDRCRVFLVDCVNPRSSQENIWTGVNVACFRQVAAKLEGK